MSRKLITTILLASLALSTLAVVPISADDGTAHLPKNQSFDVNNDTAGLQVVAEGTNGTLDVTVTAVENGTKTQVATGTVANTSATSSSTAKYEYRMIDAANYSTYWVNVSASTAGTTAESVEIAKLQKVSGGGFSIPDGVGNVDPVYAGAGVVALLALGAVVKMTR